MGGWRKCGGGSSREAGVVNLRRVSLRLAGRWSLFGAAIALPMALPILLPVMEQRWQTAALFGLVSVAAGALLGAVLARLFQVLGRLRFWIGVLALSGAALACIAATREVTRSGTLLIWAGLSAAILLSLWHLAAYALWVARARRLAARQ